MLRDQTISLIKIRCDSHIFAILFSALSSEAKVDAIPGVVDDKYDCASWQ